MSEPMVSVLFITYNHEKYLRQSLDSVMMQETDFAYEVVVGEDCSTDSTRRIRTGSGFFSGKKISDVPRSMFMKPLWNAGGSI